MDSTTQNQEPLGPDISDQEDFPPSVFPICIPGTMTCLYPIQPTLDTTPIPATQNKQP